MFKIVRVWYCCYWKLLLLLTLRNKFFVLSSVQLRCFVLTSNSTLNHYKPVSLNFIFVNLTKFFILTIEFFIIYNQLIMWFLIWRKFLWLDPASPLDFVWWHPGTSWIILTSMLVWYTKLATINGNTKCLEIIGSAWSFSTSNQSILRRMLLKRIWTTDDFYWFSWVQSTTPWWPK